jgi:hypothetical protein
MAFVHDLRHPDRMHCNPGAGTRIFSLVGSP